MSLLETPMTRRYWASVGGTLIEEFPMVRRGPQNGPRLADGLIILGADRCLARPADVTLDDQDVIVIQTKASRLGMYLMGQALFSRTLVHQRFPVRSVRTVAVCTADDAVLRPLAEEMGIEVFVDQEGLAQVPTS